MSMEVGGNSSPFRPKRVLLRVYQKVYSAGTGRTFMRKLAVRSLEKTEQNIRSRKRPTMVITGHTGWTDDLDFAFAHRKEVCASFMKYYGNPAAPYDGYEESDDTEEKARSQRLDKVKETASAAGVKPDHKNWVPKSMIAKAVAGTGVLLAADIAAHLAIGNKRTAGGTIPSRNLRLPQAARESVADAARGALKCARRGAPGVTVPSMTEQLPAGGKALCAALTIGTAACAAASGWIYAMHRAFDYNGKRKLAKQIIDGVAEYVTLPDGAIGLDVGCGSGALTIAAAKRNPNAEMVGCDIWSGAYRAVFTKELCQRNARAEGVSNVRFEVGDAIRLPFADESFDAVTSNYVYHNITGKDKQALLLETLRVLKKGGTFAIHDLMGKARYGDMNDFVRRLREQGYEDVLLIDTTRGRFMSHSEAVLLGLSGSTLLVGRKVRT